MEIVNLPLGPWTKLYKGELKGHSIALFENPKSELLFVIFDMKEGVPTGGVFILNQVLVFSGDISLLYQNIALPSVVLQKKGARYLILSSDPFYADFSSGSLLKDLTRHFENFMKVSDKVKEDGPSYKVAFRTLPDVGQEYRATLLEEPIFLPAMLSSYTVKAKEGKEESEAKVAFLGKNIKGNPEVLGFNSFGRSMLVGKDERTSISLVQLIAEECIINGYQPIIFDYGSHLRGLSSPNPTPGRETEPIGFSAEFISSGAKCFTDFALVSKESLGDILGLGFDQSSSLVVEKIKSIGDVVKAELSLRSKASDYYSLRASRILSLLSKYGSQGFGSNLRPEPFLPGAKARGVVVELDEPRGEIRAGIILSVMKSVLNALNPISKVKPFFIIMRCDTIFENRPLREALIKILDEISSKSLFSLVSAESEEVVPDEIFNTSFTHLNVCDRNEVVLKQKGRPAVRVTLRDLHSSPPLGPQH